MTKQFKKGDVVVYCPGYTEDIGRVTGPANDLNTYVCFTSGCTSAACPNVFLRPATDEEVAEAAAMGIGHHRFDDTCPEFDMTTCSGYCPEKAKAKLDSSFAFQATFDKAFLERFFEDMREQEEISWLKQMVKDGHEAPYGLVTWTDGEGRFHAIKIKKDIMPEGVMIIELPCQPSEYAMELAAKGVDPCRETR